MRLPRRLVIDDLFGNSIQDRRNLCKICGLNDITGDDSKPLSNAHPVAEAIFESGQERIGKSLVNSTSKALEAVSVKWCEEQAFVWSLVLLDLRFESGVVDEFGEPEGMAGDDTFGLVLLDSIHARYPNLPVIVLSSKVREDVIEDCRRRGAADFIQRHGDESGYSSPRELLQSKILEHGLI